MSWRSNNPSIVCRLGRKQDERYCSELSQIKPIIIDESDGTLDAYPRAIDLGYRGVSSKNCKSAIKSVLNAGLTWLANGRGERSEYLMTGEDLCSVGIIPTQSDLCLAATLGLPHVERNGHHYHPGLRICQPHDESALAKHGDFYASEQGSSDRTSSTAGCGSVRCSASGLDLPSSPTWPRWNRLTHGDSNRWGFE